MRELVRSDLPELLVIGERVGSFIARSTVPFALLAGIGADRIAGEVLRAIAFAVLDMLRLQYAPRPYDFQQILGPAIGLLVARRAGGAPGALAFLAYSGVVVVLGWIGRALTCAEIFASDQILNLGLASFCYYGPLDLLAGALPLFIGLGIGAVVARAATTATRAGANPLLEAAGAYTVPSVVVAFGARAFAYPAFGIAPQQVLFLVATILVSAILAGATCAARSATPIRTALGLAALLLGTWLYPIGWSQIAMTLGADWVERPEILLVAAPLVGAAAIPLAAYLADRNHSGKVKRKRSARRWWSPLVRAMRARAIVGVSIAVIALAAILGQRSAERTPMTTPAGPASSLPVASVPAISPTPAIDKGHGIVVATRDSLLVRRETDGQLIRDLPLYTRALVAYAISPDGRYVAYWARAGTSAQDYELRVYDAATNAEPRVLLRETSALYLPTSVTWASDSTAVALGVVALSPRRDDAARPPELRTIDLASGSVQTLYRADREGPLLTPIAWDREQKVIGTVELNERQVPERYLHVTEDGRVTRDNLPMAEGAHVIVGVVGDGLRGMGAAVDIYMCPGGASCSGLRVWPIEREFRHGTGPAADPQAQLRSVRFIRGSRYVLALAEGGSRGTEWRLEVIDPMARAQTLVLRRYEDAAQDREMFVRADGTAAYVFDRGDGGWAGELVALDGSASQEVPRRDLGGRPVASVVLDPQEAARVQGLPYPPHLLTRGEIQALVPRYADVRVDHESYRLTTRGEVEDALGGRSSEDRNMPVWVVARTGEFTSQGTTGPIDRDTHPPCQVRTFDARTGSAFSYALGDLAMCARIASPTTSP